MSDAIKFKVGDAAHFQIGTDFHAVKVERVYHNGRRLAVREVHGSEVYYFSVRNDGVWRMQGETYRLRAGDKHQMDDVR